MEVHHMSAGSQQAASGGHYVLVNHGYGPVEHFALIQSGNCHSTNILLKRIAVLVRAITNSVKIMIVMFQSSLTIVIDHNFLTAKEWRFTP